MWKDYRVEPLEVSAYDNFPCFDGKVTQTDKNSSSGRTCASGIVWYTQRTWTAVDKAGNKATASVLIAVKDDQAISFGDVKVAVAMPWGSVPLYVQRFAIKQVLPNKLYTVSLVPDGGGNTLTKTGRDTRRAVLGVYASKGGSLTSADYHMIM
jgi:hypothetical protein